MQYIQTSHDSYLLSVIGGLDEAYQEAEEEFVFDYEQFDEYLESDNHFGLFSLFMNTKNIHKLDKKSKFVS